MTSRTKVYFKFDLLANIKLSMGMILYKPVGMNMTQIWSIMTREVKDYVKN